MIKKIISLVMLLAINTAYADIRLIVPSPPGGGSQRTAVAMESTFAQAGFKYSAEYFGTNCQLGFDQYKKNDSEKKLFLAPVNGLKCYENVTPNEVVGINYSSSISMCTMTRNGTSLKLADFLDKKKTKTVAINHSYIPIWKNFFEELGVAGSVKFVPYENSGKVYAGFLSNDIDYVIAFPDWAIKNKDKVSCLIVAGPKVPAGLNTDAKTLKELLPPGKESTHEIIMYLLAKGFTNEEMTKLRSVLVEAKKSPQYQSDILIPGNQDISGTPNELSSILNSTINHGRKFHDK